MVAGGIASSAATQLSLFPDYSDPPPNYEDLIADVSVRNPHDFVRYYLPSEEMEQVELKTFRWSMRAWQRLESSPSPLHGPEFTCGGAKWRILAYPGGILDAPGHVSLFLTWVASENDATHKCAQFAFALSNSAHPNIFETKRSHHRFTPQYPIRGFSRFCTHDSLRNIGVRRAMLENDTLEITVFVRVLRDETGVLYEHDFREYDSKKTTGYVPLVNQGRADHLNAMLHTLFFIPQYRKAIYSVATHGDSPEESTIYALQKLFYRLQTSTSAVYANELMQTLERQGDTAWKSFSLFGIFRLFQERITDTIKNTPSEDCIHLLFGGKLRIFSGVAGTGRQSMDFSQFTHIKLQVRGTQSLQMALQTYLAVTSENLKGSVFERQVELLSLPPVLVLLLDRAEHDNSPSQREYFEYPPVLDMAPYIDRSGRTGRDRYCLFAVIAFEASDDSVTGRFISFMRSSNTRRWYRFDDHRVTPARQQDAIEDCYGEHAREPFALLYVRESDERHVFAPVTEFDIPRHIRGDVEGKEPIQSPKGLTVTFIKEDTFRRHQGFDIAAIDSPGLLELDAHWNDTLSELMSRDGMPRGVGLRLLKKRQNKTLRPDSLIPQSSFSMRLQDIQARWGNGDEENLVFFVEPADVATLPKPGLQILLFLKHFDYHTQSLLGFGPVYVSRSEKLKSLGDWIRKIMQWPASATVGLVEEVRPGMVNPIDLYQSLEDCGLNSGDIICFERRDPRRKPSRGEPATNIKDAVEFYQWLASAQASSHGVRF